MKTPDDEEKLDYARRLNRRLDLLKKPRRGRAEWLKSQLGNISRQAVHNWLEAKTLPSAAHREQIERVLSRPAQSISESSSAYISEHLYTDDRQKMLADLLELTDHLGIREINALCSVAAILAGRNKS